MRSEIRRMDRGRPMDAKIVVRDDNGPVTMLTVSGDPLEIEMLVYAAERGSVVRRYTLFNAATKQALTDTTTTNNREG